MGDLLDRVFHIDRNREYTSNRTGDHEMIYIIQEFYDGKWWLIQPFTSKFHADEYLSYLTKKKDKYGAYRIKEFELPKSMEE